MRRIFVALLLALAAPAQAHHSAAMFDRDKTLVVAGTVREFQWNSPHCWIQLTAPDGAEWSIEMVSPIELFRAGWKPGTLKAGDKVTVTFNPERSGGRGGLFVSALGADGQPVVRRK